MSNRIIPLKQTAAQEYKHQQKEIEKLIRQIESGLREHHLDAREEGPNWGHVGDLASIAETLTDIKDRLQGTGEYMGESADGLTK